jgi:hypothetical protein
VRNCKLWSLTIGAALIIVPATGAELPRPVDSIRPLTTPVERSNAAALRTRGLAAEAYIWGIPPFLNFGQATEFKAARHASAPGEEPFGGWMLLRDLATPATLNVMPNVDTLYGMSFILLDRQGPVVLEIPATEDRYFSVALLDAYFNAFAVLGSREMRNSPTRILIAPPSWSGAIPASVDRVIRTPTPCIAVVQRVFVSGRGDLAAARALQDQIALAPLAGGRFPPIETPDYDTGPGIRRTTDPFVYFGAVADYTRRNPPSPDFSALMTAFAEVGLGPGARLPDEAGLRTAVAQGAADGQQILDAAVAEAPVRNGWLMPDPEGGRPGPSMLRQAVLQLTQIGSLPADEAIYFVARLDGAGAPLDGRASYDLVFPPGGLPPVEAGGFWSVTLYKASDSLLFANALDRYAIRPTSPGLDHGADGSLSIRIGHAAPPGGPDANWLPAPTGGFILTLRAYRPSRAIADGSWLPPPVRKLDGR